MPVPIDPRRTVPYVLKAERPLPAGAIDPPEALAEENARRAASRATFHLGALTPSEWAVLEDRAFAANGSASQVGSIHLGLLRSGLRGWDWPGGPAFVPRLVNGEPRGVSDESIAALRPDDRTELALAIDRLNHLGDPDAGK